MTSRGAGADPAAAITRECALMFSGNPWLSVAMHVPWRVDKVGRRKSIAHASRREG
jgi:hypothetical protein